MGPEQEDKPHDPTQGGASVPYEDHAIRADHETTLVGGLFDAMEEITKSAVGLSKQTAGAFVELGRELTRDAGSPQVAQESRAQDAPAHEDRSPPEEDRDALARRARADAQWAEIVRSRAKEQDRDLER